MITCPKCGELNGDNNDTCFNCYTKLVVTNETDSDYGDVIVTKSDTIDDKKISKYLGTVSGTSIYLIGGLVGEGFTDSGADSYFDIAYRRAESTMVSKAKAKKADAIISVQTNVVSPGNLNNIIVTIQGTAVSFEKTSE